MRDYATISKRLRRYSENCVAYKLDADFANAVTDAADAIEELLDELTTIRKQLPHWISVEERLPEKYHQVLCYGENGILVDYYSGETSVLGRPLFMVSEARVSHWMPLPTPPKGVE